MGLGLKELQAVRQKIEDFLREKQNADAAYAAHIKRAEELRTTQETARITLQHELAVAKADLASERAEQLAAIRQRQEDLEKTLDYRQNEVQKAVIARELAVAEREASLERAIREKSVCFPWIAEAISRLHDATFSAEETRLRFKQHAPKSADAVREFKKLVNQYKEEAEICRFRVRYYERLFPWLADYVDQDIDDLLIAVKRDGDSTESESDASDQDPVINWVSHGEFHSLTTTERNQRALENWRRSRRKSNWHVGRDYERFVGHRFEHSGYRVRYSGALEGLEDMGRDLVAMKEDETVIAQCKYWSSEKAIHEKHVFQLYGTCVEYVLKEHERVVTEFPLIFGRTSTSAPRVVPQLITSTMLSDRAREVAAKLGVQVVEGLKLDPDYPIIKCNLSRSTGARIYHLPFDQQYDTTVVEFEKGEFYAKSVQEAESKGFRRAWRYRGP